MPGKRHKKVRSRAQAGLFGIVAGGGRPRGGALRGITRAHAKAKLKGVRVRKLVKRIGRKRRR
jgi:hypothetical protein